MDELLEKLINDTLSPAELLELRERFNITSDEELEALLKNHEATGHYTEIPEGIIEHTKKEIDCRLFGNHEKAQNNRFMRIFTTVAAAVLLLVAGGLISYLISRPSENTAACTLSTARNETSSLILSDGSAVKVNGNSSLSFPSAFSKDARQVAFTGEAYFDVSKNPDAPFTIITPTMTVTVTGTSFNILARPGTKYSELSLDSGSVSVSPSGSDKTTVVEPGTKLILDNETSEITVLPLTHAASTSSWTYGELHFDNATPKYVIDRIEQVYDTVLDPQIKRAVNDNFTGTLPSNDLDNALRILRKIYAN